MRVLISIQQPVIAWQIPEAGIARLREQFPEIDFIHATDDATRTAGLAAAEVAYTWILSAPELAAAPHLRWVHTSAVAVETLCLPELFARDIIVSNSRGVQSAPIAEHVLAVLLALAKQLPLAIDRQRAARWAQNDFVGDRMPWLLKGKTLGIVGVGTIGSEIARLAGAFGMRVIGARRRPELGTPAGIDTVVGAESLPELLAAADVVVIAAPLTDRTQQLIGAAEIARMKRGSLLINVGRARILDHATLVDALRTGHLAGAALDVFPREPLPADDPLWTAPNVIITPHTSGFRRGHWDDVIELFSDNLRRYQRGEPIRFRVAPELGY